MVTLNKYTTYGANRNVLELVALDSDILPTDSIEGMQITNGSTAIILDATNHVFKAVKMFDEENSVWCD